MQTETPRRRWIASEDAQQLWREYNRTKDSRLRDRLIMTYAPLVKYIAYRKVRELPASCQVEDFISCGLEALITAIDRYDPEKGATLEQFAWTRIHGAILDELRRQDWAPRSVRRWERDIEAARRNFAGVHGRQPRRDELARTYARASRRSRPPTSPRSTRSSRARRTRTSSASTRWPPTTSPRTRSTSPRWAMRRTASAPPSAACRSASARSPSCSTSRS